MAAYEVNVLDRRFKIFISASAINSRIITLAENISNDVAGSDPVFLCVLNGAFFFASDILKKLDFDCEISFVKLASYEGMNSTGDVRTLIGLEENLTGRHVIIIEDIVDTGLSMYKLIQSLSIFNPLSIKIATLILKRSVCKYDLPLQYVGFEVEDKFLVGYGLDYNKHGRHYNDIYAAIG